MAQGSFLEATHNNAQRWADLANAARNKNTLSLAQNLLANVTPFESVGGKSSAPSVDQSGNQESPFGRLIDILTTPLAGVAGVLGGIGDEVRDIASGEMPDFTSPVNRAIKGVAGNIYSAATGDPNVEGKESIDKVTQEILDAQGAQQVGLKPNQIEEFLKKYDHVEKPAWLSGVDLAGDIFLDPLTYTGVGLAGKLGKAGKVIAEVGDEAPDIAKATGAVEKVVTPIPEARAVTEDATGQMFLPGMGNKTSPIAMPGPAPRTFEMPGSSLRTVETQQPLPGMGLDELRAQEVPGAFPKVVANNEPALFAREAFEGGAAERARSRALNAKRGVPEESPSRFVQDEFNTAGLMFTKKGKPYAAFDQTKLAPDVAEALAPVAAKAGIDLEKIAATRDVAKIRSLIDEPIFEEAAAPVAKSASAPAPEKIETYANSVLHRKFGTPATTPQDMIPAEFPNGVIRDVKASGVLNAIRTGTIDPSIKSIKFSLENGDTVSIEKLVQGGTKYRGSAAGASPASTGAARGTPATVRSVREAWTAAAKAAGLTDREIEKVLTSKDAKKTIETIAKNAEGRSKAVEKTAADSGVPASSVKNEPVKLDNPPPISNEVAQIAENQPVIANRALEELRAESPRTGLAIDNATAFEAKQINKDPRARPTPEEAKAQKAAIGQTYSVKTPGGVKRNNPQHQRNLLSRLGRSDAVRKLAIPRKGEKMTHDNHIVRATRLFKMLQAAEEQMKLMGYVPMMFHGESAAFRLSEFLSAVAKDIDTTVEDLLVRMNYTGKGVAADDKQLVDTITKALVKGNNKGLREMAQTYPSVHNYIHTSQTVQKIIDAKVIPQVQAEASELLAVSDISKGVKATTDAQDFKTVSHDVPLVVNELTGKAGGSPEAANEVISEMTERIIPRADNETVIESQKVVRQINKNVDDGKPSVAEHKNTLEAADRDTGLGAGATREAKIENTWDRLNYAMLAWKGYKNLYNVHMDNLQGAQALAHLSEHIYRKAIKELGITPETYKGAWAVLRGEERALTPEVQDAIQFIEQRMGNILQDSTVANAYRIGQSDTLRAGITMHEWNRTLKQLGINFRFTEDVPPGYTWKDSWRFYDGEDDPFSLAFKLESAMHTSAAKKAVFADIHYLFNKPGGVRIKGVPELSETYVDPLIAKEIPTLMSRLEQAYSPSGKFGQAVDSFLSSWKSGVTIYLPSHHIRNMIGDLTFAWFAGVPVGDPRLIAKMTKVFRAKKALYSDIKPDASGAEILTEMLKGNNAGRILNTPVAEHSIISRVTGKGGTVSFTPDMLYQGAFERGVIKHSKVLEDIPSKSFSEILAEKNPALKAIFRPTGGRAQRAGRFVSESREHAVRLMHFIDKTEKFTKRNLARGMKPERAMRVAMDEASASVRKWHPDGSTLTEWEKKHMRRIFPFYSWTRKAIPLLAESMLVRPGKLTLYPKVMYGIQNMTGADPQNLANPWPTDQMFPQWLREMPIGPMGNALLGYTVVNPGTPFTDLGNQFLNDPISGVAGMVNPLARIPAEVATRTDTQTTAPIKDWSEYIDKQIPPAALFNRLFNTNIGAGSVANLVGGDASLPLNKTGRMEGPVNSNAIINFLLAAGLIDASKPNYIKQAEFEQRDRKAEASRIRKEQAQGVG